jgi:cellulose synthase operon protein C
LLRSDNPSVATAASRWAVIHEKPVSTLPANTIADLLAHASAPHRTAGARLFAALDDDTLIKQPELVAQLAASPDADVRKAVRPAIDRLAPKHAAFAKSVAEYLLAPLFRAEQAEGQHHAIVELLVAPGPLAAQANALDDDTVWRLLQAKAQSNSDLRCCFRVRQRSSA